MVRVGIDYENEDRKPKPAVGLNHGPVQYLDRVENATKKTVFSESCFIVRVSFCPKFSIYLRTILIS